MIMHDQELTVTQQRIRQFQDLLLRLRQGETAEHYALMAHAYLLEIDKMNEEIRGYLATPPRPQPEAVHEREAPWQGMRRYFSGRVAATC